MKVEELTGVQLDCWVARAEGLEPRQVFDTQGPFYATRHTSGAEIPVRPYSRCWGHGGEIIQRENIQISPPTSPVHRCGGPNASNGQSGLWSACTWHRGADGRRAIARDEKSALVAAMRCFVRSKFGETVPDEVQS